MPSSDSSPPSSSKSSSSNNVIKLIYTCVWLSIISYGIFFAGYWAYNIRLLAIEEFGPIIHEFDPYFNFRATEYLYEHGWRKFVTWFDYMVWYPLGRPVGTTIYPGMQVAAVFLKNLLRDRMSLNDVCVYIPAWFGVVASLLTGLMAYECSLPQNTSQSIVGILMDLVRGRKGGKVEKKYSPAVEVGVVTACIMAVVPAHLMRSIGGGYDNESVAVTAMTLTFFMWVRSLRSHDEKSYLWGIGTGFAYFFMAATWGGYVFVLNMIGVHAAVLVILGRFSEKLYKAYTLFYVIGTGLAIQIPVVGMTPLKSLEQLGPCAVFFGYQVLYFCRLQVQKRKMSRMQAVMFHLQIIMLSIVLGGLIIYTLAPTGYFGPISSRVRGLFVKHTRTGNPLVDSVAEHQPASQQAYFQYLHYLYYTAPVGFCFVFVYFGDAPSFLTLYAVVAYFFSAKMVRLVLLLAPIASALGGVVVGRISAWSIRTLLSWFLGVGEAVSDDTQEIVEDEKAGDKSKKSKSKKKDSAAAEKDSVDKKSKDNSFTTISKALKSASKSKEGNILKRILGLLFLAFFVLIGQGFKDYCWMLCRSLSQATIVMKGRTRDGKEVLVDDYRDAYLWLKDNTPESSRILAWWDYGYQITAISNRTTIADGNTWNHEHIALLGRVLTSPVDEGYEIARHLADYVLVWAGGGGDDLAKSPHLARIANSVYRHMCPNDPTCRAFGFIDQHGSPSAMMKRSFLFNLHSHNIRPGVTADPSKFKEVYRSRYGKVRIYKLLGVSRASKDWVANPKNRRCDAPGSWFCPGQYPPALKKILDEKKDFAQLEDFNRKNVDEEYTKQYFENMADPGKAKAEARRMEREHREQNKKSEGEKKEDLKDLNEQIEQWKSQLSEEKKQLKYNNWEDTDETTLMWRVISSGNLAEFKEIMSDNPELAFVRSADGRGPVWWAYEAADKELAYILTMIGVSNKDKDKYGMTPYDLLPEKARNKKKKKD